MPKRINSFDVSSKQMLKEKSLRAALVKYLVDGYQNLSFDEIKGLLSEVSTSIDETIPKRKVGFDALFTVNDPNDKGKVGVFVNVETQGYKLKDPKLVGRALYYCCRMIERQHTKDDSSFIGTNYEDIKKVYSIWIITADHRRCNSINSIKFTQDTTNSKHPFDGSCFDKVEMIFLYTDSNYEEISNELIAIISMIFSVDESLNNRIDVLKYRYNLDLTDKEVDIMNGWVTKNDNEIRNLIKKEKENSLNEGLQKGHAMGLEEGKLVGLEEGKAIGLEMGLAISIKHLMQSQEIDFEAACQILDITESKNKILDLVKNS